MVTFEKKAGEYEAHAEGFALLPEGEYPAMITDVSEKTSKTGNKYLGMKFQVVDGEYKGRVLFHNLNLWHEKKLTQDISWGQLSKIGYAATGNKSPATGDEVLNKPMTIVVSVRPESGGYQASNEIKGWKPLDESSDDAVTEDDLTADEIDL